MRIKTVHHRPYSPDLAPCDFWLFPKLRGCHYETIEEMKEAVMKVIDMLTQEDFHEGLLEVVGMVQLVHCSRRRLFRRGLEFHVCTIYKSAHMKKVWKLIICTSYKNPYMNFCHKNVFFLYFSPYKFIKIKFSLIQEILSHSLSFFQPDKSLGGFQWSFYDDIWSSWSVLSDIIY